MLERRTLLASSFPKINETKHYENNKLGPKIKQILQACMNISNRGIHLSAHHFRYICLIQISSLQACYILLCFLSSLLLPLSVLLTMLFLVAS